MAQTRSTRATQRRSLEKETLVYCPPRAIRYSPGSQLSRICTQMHRSTTTPYTQGFRLRYRHSRRRLGSPWVGPMNAALKRLKLVTVTPGAQPQPCPSLPLLSSSAGFRTPFPLPTRSRSLCILCCTNQTSGSSAAAVLQCPVMPNSRRSSARSPSILSPSLPARVFPRSPALPKVPERPLITCHQPERKKITSRGGVTRLHPHTTIPRN